MTSPSRSRYQVQTATQSTNQKLSSKAIEELQEQAEELFGEMKYLQSAKIAAQIAAACDSKEYSAEVVAKFNQVCVSDLISKEKFKQAALVLKEILAIVENSLLKGGEDAILPEVFAEYQNLKRLTLNNLGCALKKSGQIDEAQFYFEQITNQDPLYELNLCAVQNQKGDHRQALIHAQQAATLLEAEVKDLRAQDHDDSADRDYFLERTSLLAIAYYNQGCELEHLENLIRATQAFSRAVSLQSSKHANQQLLSQFKLSLKQARFKLRQQMVPGGQNNQRQMMSETTSSVPIYHDGTKFGIYENQGFFGDKRPFSAIQNNFAVSPYRFQTAGGKKELPRISKVQATSINKVDKNSKGVMRMSIHSNMSRNSNHSELSEQQKAIVDQMNQRPPHLERRFSRGKKQANQSGPNSNSLRQKQQALKASQADLGTGLGFTHGRSSSATMQKPLSMQKNTASSAEKTAIPRAVLPSIPQPKARNQSESQVERIAVKSVIQDKKVINSKILQQDNKQKPPFSNASKLYPNKKVDNSKALKALVDLGLAKGSVYQQEKALDAIIRIQRWIRIRILRQNLTKAMKINQAAKKNAKKPIVPQKPTNSVSKVANRGVVTQAQKSRCAKMIQSLFRRRRFRKLVHAMIIRRKVQLGYYSKDYMMQIEESIRKKLNEIDKKQREAQIEKKAHQKRDKAIRMIQRKFRLMRWRRIVTCFVRAIRELKDQKPIKNSLREAFLKRINQKAKEIREAELQLATIHRVNLSKSAKVLQSWIRRRRFRKAVDAMILFRKVKNGTISIKKLSNVDAFTYQSILNANKLRKIEEKRQKEDDKREKAAKTIQSLFRRRRFRNLVTIVCKILKQKRLTGKINKHLSPAQQEKEQQSSLQQAFMLHKAQVKTKAIQESKRRKAVLLIQSYVRRRRFRKLVEARLLLHKFQQGKVKASALKKIDPKIRESILSIDRENTIEQRKLQRGVKVIQRFVRRRKFRQLVYWIVQVKRLSNKQLGYKSSKLTDKQISQLAEKANVMRKQHNQKLIEERRRERIARKVIVSFVRRWKFRRAVQALIASKRVKNPNAFKKISPQLKAQVKLSNEIKEKREQIAIKQRQMEICARVIQRFVRCRRFRLTVEAIVAVNRMHRDSNNIYQVMFQQKIWEARAYKQRVSYDRIVQQRKEKKAIKLIQSFIRRRNFRRVVDAIVYQIKVQKGLIEPRNQKKATQSHLIQKQVDNWSRETRKADSEKLKLLKAVRMIQSWFRRRKFRKLVEAIIELKRAGKKSTKSNKLSMANDLRKKKMNEEIAERSKMLKAVKVVQRWFRRRRFRQLVFAIIVRNKVQKKKLSGESLKQFSKQTLDRLNLADAEQKKFALQSKKEEKAIKLVQRWYRVRRFRKAVLAIVQAGRQLAADWANKRHYLSPKEKLLFDERVVMKANFIRKQELKKEIEYRARLKRSTKLIQSWWRRRKFRKAVNQVIARKRKSRPVVATANSKIAKENKTVARKTFQHAESPQIQKQSAVSRNTTTALKTKSNTELHHRNKPIDPTVQAHLTEVPSSQKIVIDYWQDGMQVEFQQAFSKKKPLVMVNLVINSQTIDRKVIPIDLYHSALDAGHYDLHQFCDQSLMPCIQIKEKNGKYSLEVLDELVQEFLQKNSDFQLDYPRINTANSSFARGSEQNEGVLKLLNKKLTGMMPLVKRSAILNNKEFIVQAICDFDMHLIKLTAEREDAYLYLNVQMTQNLQPTTSDMLPGLCTYASDLTHQLQIVDDELQLRKALPCLHDEQVILRTSATIKDRFYLISIGHQNGNMIIEALDKAREIRLWLKHSKYSADTHLGQDEANNLVARLDTKTVGGQTVLVLK